MPVAELAWSCRARLQVARHPSDVLHQADDVGEDAIVEPPQDPAPLAVRAADDDARQLIECSMTCDT